MTAVVIVTVTVVWGFIAALAGFGAGQAWHNRRQITALEHEIAELQAWIDVVLLKQGGRPYFAQRYDLDYVIDPDVIPPPDGYPGGAAT